MKVENALMSPELSVICSCSVSVISVDASARPSPVECAIFRSPRQESKYAESPRTSKATPAKWQSFTGDSDIFWSWHSSCWLPAFIARIPLLSKITAGDLANTAVMD